MKKAQPKLPKVCELITQGIRCMVDLFLNVGMPRNVARGKDNSVRSKGFRIIKFLTCLQKVSFFPQKVTFYRDLI